MNIPKAIEILTEITTTCIRFHTDGQQDAIKLAIEALKQRKWEKEAGYLDNAPLLPGETED